MHLNRNLIFAIALLMAGPASAQEIDCSIPENAEREVCLGLPDQRGITNFAPLVAPLLGLAAVGALAGGQSSGATSTTSTTD